MRGSLRGFTPRRFRVYTSHLGVTHPELAMDFDEEKNDGLKIENITYGSEKRVWWKCSTCNHSWAHSVFRRTLGQGNCPKCSLAQIEPEKTLAFRYPNIAKEWDGEKNGELSPKFIYYGSTKKVHWKCSTCAHEWPAPVRSRTMNGAGCPVCVRKKHHANLRKRQLFVREDNLKEIMPELEVCFDVEKNHPVRLEYLTKTSNRAIYWTCPHCDDTIHIKVMLFSKGIKYKTCDACGKPRY